MFYLTIFYIRRHIDSNFCCHNIVNCVRPHSPTSTHNRKPIGTHIIACKTTNITKIRKMNILIKFPKHSQTKVRTPCGRTKVFPTTNKSHLHFMCVVFVQQEVSLSLSPEFFAQFNYLLCVAQMLWNEIILDLVSSSMPFRRSDPGPDNMTPQELLWATFLRKQKNDMPGHKVSSIIRLCLPKANIFAVVCMNEE